MDELEISGKRFISSKRAAKENKYHVDYIGQLIRGGKIVGSKVGRTWYVDAESLAQYLGKEYKERAPITAINAQPATKIEYTAPQAANITQIESPARLKYLSDDEMAPVVQKMPLQYVQKEKVEENFKQEQRVVVKSQEQRPITSRNAYLKVALAVGVLLFGAAFGASSLFSYTNSIQGSENTASISFFGL